MSRFSLQNQILNTIARAQAETRSAFPIKNGKIIRVNSDKTYDVQTTGTDAPCLYYRLKSFHEDVKFYKGEFVIIMSPFYNSNMYVVLAQSPFRFPDKVVHEFEW